MNVFSYEAFICRWRKVLSQIFSCCKVVGDKESWGEAIWENPGYRGLRLQALWIKGYLKILCSQICRQRTYPVGRHNIRKCISWPMARDGSTQLWWPSFRHNLVILPRMGGITDLSFGRDMRTKAQESPRCLWTKTLKEQVSSKGKFHPSWSQLSSSYKVPYEWS